MHAITDFFGPVAVVPPGKAAANTLSLGASGIPQSTSYHAR